MERNGEKEGERKSAAVIRRGEGGIASACWRTIKVERFKSRTALFLFVMRDCVGAFYWPACGE